MKIVARVALGAAGLSLAVAAAAQEPTPIELRPVPTGSWTVDFAVDRCVALRRYEAGGKPIIVALEPEVGRESLKVTLRLPPDDAMERALVEGREGRSLFVNGAQVASNWVAGPAAEPGLLLIGGHRLIRLDQLNQMTSVEMRSPTIDVRVPLGGMARLAPVLAKCGQSLLASYGLSMADQERLARWPRPKAAIGSYIKDGDYPGAAIRKGEQGRVHVRLWVPVDGRPTSCVVRQSSGSALLDKTTCNLLQSRVRFDPARDKSGAAMAAPAFAELRWAIPF